MQQNLYPRRILLSHTTNTRDLGGYQTSNNKITNYGRIIRSDVPNNFSKEDFKIMERYHIYAAIDVRGDKHFKETANAYQTIKGIQFYHIPITGGFKELAELEKNSKEHSYLSIVEMHKPEFLRVFQVIAQQNDGAVIYNCKAGKDRTGIISALILSLCGVPESDIIADYEISYTLNYEKFPFEEGNERSNYFLSPPEYMRNFLAYIHQKYQNAAGYLADIGLTQEEIQQIKTKLLQ